MTSQKSIGSTDEADLFSTNLSQTKKIYEMEKQLDYWKEKCLDLQLNLSMQKVEESDLHNAKNTLHSKSEKDSQKMQKEVKSLTDQVIKLQKDIENQHLQKKNLQLQISQKDKQIDEFQKETQSRFDSIIDLQKKLDKAASEVKQQEKEKDRLEREMAELKDENTNLTKTSTNNSSSEMSPEQYLDVLSEEKDLNQMLHFCQLVNAKYMQMMSQQYLEQLSKGGPGAGNPGASPGMPPMGGMMPGQMPGGFQSPQLNQQMFNPMAQFQNMPMGGQMPGMQMASPMGINSNQAAFGPMVPPNFQQDFNGRQ